MPRFVFTVAGFHAHTFADLFPGENLFVEMKVGAAAGGEIKVGERAALNEEITRAFFVQRDLVRWRMKRGKAARDIRSAEDFVR